MALLFVLATQLACGPLGGLPAPVETVPIPALDARFQPRQGWIGGDGAYSVALGPERTVWLFCDTWVGRVQDGRRVGATLVNNSVAVQHGHGAAARLHFVVRRGPGGQPAALLAPTDGRGWLWFQAGAYLHGRLYLFLTQVEKQGQGAFGFRPVAQWLGVVANPQADPLAWRVEQRRLPCAEFSRARRRSYGAAVWQEGGWLYIYGTDEQPAGGFPNRQLVLARVQADAVEDFAAWRFYRQGRWLADFHQAGELADGLATECSVSYLAAARGYLLVYTERGLSERIVARTAARPWGPWSAPVVLYRCPEGKWGQGIFCYGAKAHPEEAGGAELMVSYVANATDFGQVVRDARLYWPRFIRLRWPAPGARTREGG